MPLRLTLPAILLLTLVIGVRADDADVPADEPDSALKAPAQVDVQPESEDTDIAGRLQRILQATEWFESPRVRVDEGVVFLSGTTSEDRYKKWADDLATSTQDVVGVVNRIRVTEPAFWDLSPAWASMRELTRDFMQALPMIGVGLVLLLITWWFTQLTRRLSRSFLSGSIDQPMLLTVTVNVIGALVFLMGIYLVLKIAGLTRLAATVIGGTGLFGLVVGIAFRDIAENFLASILISLQRPFQQGDLVEIDDRLGFVEAVTIRGTLLMDFEGNHIQLPNSTIYKGVIKNYTANPNVRLDFAVGIDYGDSVTAAQEAALDVVREHAAVLEEPGPMVLVEELGASTVNLRVYFWVNGSDHSGLKVKSALIRLVKSRFERDGLTMPDESREVIFPSGVPVHMVDAPPEPAREPERRTIDERDAAASGAEGNLDSDADEIRRQARTSRRPEEGADMLTEPLATSA